MTPELQPPPGSETQPANRRWPVWPWVAGTIVLTVATAGFCFWWPMHRAHQLIEFIEANGGSVGFECDHPEWAVMLDEDTYHPWFDRVFEVEMTAIPASDPLLDDLQMFPEMMHLYINVSRCSPSAIRRLSEFERFELLLLRGSGEPIPLEWLTSLPDLQYLDFEGIPLSQADWNAIVACPRLEYIGIDGAPFETTLSANAQIDMVCFWGVTLERKHGEALAAISSLSELSVTDCRTAPGFWSALASHPALTSVDVSDVAFESESLTEVFTLSSISGLSIWGKIELTSAQVKSMKQLKSLESLSFHDALLPDDDSWSALAALPSLQHVEFSDSTVGDAAAEALAASPSITVLSFDGTRLTDAGLDRLAQFPALMELNIYNSRITEEGVERFRAARPEVDVLHY